MTSYVHLRKRYRREKVFRFFAFGSCVLALVFLGVLFGGIVAKGLPGFFKTSIYLEIGMQPEWVTYDSQKGVIRDFDYRSLVLSGMKRHFPQHRQEQEEDLVRLLSPSTRKTLYLLAKRNPKLIGQTVTGWFSASDDVHALVNDGSDMALSDENRRLSRECASLIASLQDKAMIRQSLNPDFFLAPDSREPVAAGIMGAAIGTFYLMVVTLLISFPLGVAAAIYLEEFPTRSRLSHLIEISISNLAAIPSIVFGILGLAVFINILGLPRSSPLVGGMTLSLMTLPTIIVAGRSALRQVPSSIRDAARGLGASPVQVVFHHVLPLGLPGILTGTIISMARALGETAPLLMVGMMAFIADFPALPTDAATALPVQIFTWARNPEPGFVANAAAAILVLLIFLGIMNLGAIILRNRFEYKW